MKIHHKLLIAFSALAGLALLVGLYSLHAMGQIIRSFEGGEEHFRTIIAAATEVNSYAQRAKGHLYLYLILHDSEDLTKFYDRSRELSEQLSLLDRTVKVPAGREILRKLHAHIEDFTQTGQLILKARQNEMARGRKFDPGRHAPLIRYLYSCCANVGQAAAELEYLETNFLNKQAAITTSSELADLTKVLEGYLMLSLTLRGAEDLKRYEEGWQALERTIATLDRQVQDQEAMDFLVRIRAQSHQLEKTGSILLVTSRALARAGKPFVPEEHAREILAFHEAASLLRQSGLDLTRALASLEYDKKTMALKAAASLQRFVFVLAVVGGLLVFALGYFLSVAVAHPLSKLKESAEQLGHGQIEVLPRVGGRGEIVQLADSFQQIASELREARDELLSAKEYTDNILRSMTDALFVISPEGTLQTLNMATSILLGYEEKELIGRPFADLLGPSPPFRFDPEDLGQLPTGQRVEMELKGKDRTILVSFSCSIMYDRANQMEGVVCVAQDILEQKRTMEELARLAIVVERAAEAIVITDPQGRIQYINPAFEKITGYSQEEAIGASPAILKSGKHPPQFYEDLWRTLTRGEIWSGFFVNRRKDGQLYEEECIISPVRDPAGRIINYVALKRDVTHEKRLERQLIQSQKHEALGTLAGGIAHDLNNILTPVVGYANLAISRTAPDDKIYHYLAKILQASGRASNLVNQILTFGRKHEQRREALPLGPVLEEALALLRATLPSTIEIRTAIDPSCRPVLADSNQMHQVLMNLCTNAYQAMREQGGLLEVSLTEVKSPAAAQQEQPLGGGAWVRIQVRDTGCGMSQDTLTRIFEPYFTTKKQGEGSGLGLATVHGIIKKHDGTVSVRSTPGQGTTFDVYLPALSGDDTGKQEEGACPAPLPGARRQLHILLVDDEEMVLELGAEILRNLGYQVTCEADSREALRLFQENPEHFDLVLTDQTMPHLTGIQLARNLLRLRPGVPVILTSGFSEMIGENAARSMGIREYVSKPFNPSLLARTISSVLGKADRPIDN